MSEPYKCAICNCPIGWGEICAECAKDMDPYPSDEESQREEMKYE